MTAERFTAGQLFIERTKHREGPPVVYSVMCGNSARLFTDHKALLRWVKWPSKTPTGDALREWLASFDEKPKAPAIEPDWAKIKSEIPPVVVDPITGEEMQGDAMANTKMCFERFVCK
jgi:hypothetical protein|tara:strand:+ start:762 stop:1115 length:354 start_codon:yes stop_codon:yes gene_type:complete